MVEIGPGPGGLTRALLAQGARRVIAIERDERALAALAEIAARYPGRLEIVAGDALAFDPRPLVGSAPARIVANLPYNIATALLVALAHARAVAALVRPAGADVPARGRRAHRRRARLRRATAGSRCWPAGAARRASCSTSPPSAFVPPPKVTSSLVELVPRPAPLACDRRRAASG